MGLVGLVVGMFILGGGEDGWGGSAATATLGALLRSLFVRAKGLCAAPFGVAEKMSERGYKKKARQDLAVQPIYIRRTSSNLPPCSLLDSVSESFEASCLVIYRAS